MAKQNQNKKDHIPDWQQAADDVRKYKKDNIKISADYKEKYFKDLNELEIKEAQHAVRARFFNTSNAGRGVNTIANPDGANFGNPAGGERATANTVVNCSLVYIDASGATQTQNLGPASLFDNGSPVIPATLFYWMKIISFPLPHWQYAFLADFVDGAAHSLLQKSVISP